ncbi:MAG: 4Fe-4S dicluster domain-containing protein [Bacillota bacterium]
MSGVPARGGAAHRRLPPRISPLSLWKVSRRSTLGIRHTRWVIQSDDVPDVTCFTIENQHACGGVHVKVITVDPEVCTGCKACEMACSFAHTDTFSPDLSRIKVAKDEHRGLDFPVVCRMCYRPACVQICPTGAIYRRDTGTIGLHTDLCSGCGLCIEACPHAAISMHPRDGIPLICDLCKGDPQCVKRCMTGALRYEERSQAESRQRHRLAGNLWGTEESP